MPYDGEIKDFVITEVPTPTIDPDLKKVLQDARTLIKKGWTQRTLRKGNRVCLIGAIYGAVPDATPLRLRAINHLGKVIDPRAFPPLAATYIVQFNDAKWRTKQDVLDMIDLAIKEPNQS